MFFFFIVDFPIDQKDFVLQFYRKWNEKTEQEEIQRKYNKKKRKKTRIV